MTVANASDGAQLTVSRLEFALDAVHVGFWWWDAATDLVTLNAPASALFGLPDGERVTRTRMRELMHPEDRERVRLAVENALADRGQYDIEYRVQRADGVVWLAAKGRVVSAPDGGILEMLGVVQDITERRQAEEALEEETRVLDLLNHTGRAIASELDLGALLQLVTDAATELSGAKFGAFFYNVVAPEGGSYQLYTLSGAPRAAFDSFGMPRATPVFHPTFVGEGVLRLADVTRDARYGTMPPHHGMPKGHLPVRSYLAVPVISRSKEVLGGLFFGHPEPGVFTERSERLVVGIAGQAAIAIDNARLYEASQRSAAERQRLLESEQAARGSAERIVAEKDEFLATVSHELRTPLVAIQGWAHVGRTRQLGEEDIRHAFEVIERNAVAQAALVDDLLDMSRLSAGQLRVEVQLLDAREFVGAAVDTVRPAAELKGVVLAHALGADPSPVRGDPNRLQQVVWNLVSNAVKFTPAGGSVTVTLRHTGSHVEVAVADTGVGVAPEFLPFAFDRFRQADASSTRRHGGLGLGLSIAKQLVELHGGVVSVASEGEGRGSVFTVSLPAAR